jgi:hypothetical protein
MLDTIFKTKIRENPSFKLAETEPDHPYRDSLLEIAAAEVGTTLNSVLSYWREIFPHQPYEPCVFAGGCAWWFDADSVRRPGPRNVPPGITGWRLPPGIHDAGFAHEHKTAASLRAESLH